MSQEYRFVCPACGASIVVDRHVREALLAQDCVVCSSAVRPRHFEAL